MIVGLAIKRAGSGVSQVVGTQGLAEQMFRLQEGSEAQFPIDEAAFAMVLE